MMTGDKDREILQEGGRFTQIRQKNCFVGFPLKIIIIVTVNQITHPLFKSLSYCFLQVPATYLRRYTFHLEPTHSGSHHNLSTLGRLR